MENKAKIEIKLEEVVQTLPSSPSAQSPAGPAQAQPQPVNTYYDSQGRKIDPSNPATRQTPETNQPSPPPSPASSRPPTDEPRDESRDPVNTRVVYPLSEKERKEAYRIENDWVAKGLQNTVADVRRMLAGVGLVKPDPTGENPFLTEPKVFDDSDEDRPKPSKRKRSPSNETVKPVEDVVIKPASREVPENTTPQPPPSPTTPTTPPTPSTPVSTTPAGGSGGPSGPGSVAGNALVAARTANSWSNSTTQLLSTVGTAISAAAGPFIQGMKAGAAAIGGLVVAAKLLDYYINSRAKTLAPFSATLSMGQAQNQVVDIMSNYRRAQRLEDELVKYIRSSNETSNAIKDLKDELLKAILPLVNQVSGPVSDLLTLSAEGWRNINDGGFPEKLEGIVNILAKIAGFGAIIPPGFWEEIREAAEFIRQERNQGAISIIDNILNNVELRNAPFAPFQPDPQAPRPPAMGAF